MLYLVGLWYTPLGSYSPFKFTEALFDVVPNHVVVHSFCFGGPSPHSGFVRRIGDCPPSDRYSTPSVLPFHSFYEVVYQPINKL